MTRDMKALEEANEVVLQAMAKVGRANFALRLANDELKEAQDAFEAVYSPNPSFKVYLVGSDQKQMIEVIKTIRALTSTSLKEAKEMFDSVVEGKRVLVKTYFDRQEAEYAGATLKKAGLIIEIES